MSLRLLHTADWHLGQTLHGIDRRYEHEQLVRWVLDTIQEESVDAVLIAGDVFDGANPPTEAQALWYRFLVEAWRGTPHLQVVVTGGNHDSGARLEAVHPFLHAMDRLHIVGVAARRGGDLEVARMVVPLRGRDREVRAWVTAVPFLRLAETGAGPADAVAKGVACIYGAVLEHARLQRAPGQALVAMGHLYIAGGRTSDRSERRLVVGNQTAVPHDIFPEDLAYVALGHLHLAQGVGRRENVRYSGSLLPLALAERAYDHGVVLVDIEGERATAIRPVPVPRFVEMLRIPADGEAASVQEVLDQISSLPERRSGNEAARPLLEVSVRLERPEPALRHRVEEAMASKDARLARLGVVTAGTGGHLAASEGAALADLQPEQVFDRMWEREYGGAPPAEITEAFHEILEAVHQEGP